MASYTAPAYVTEKLDKIHEGFKLYLNTPSDDKRLSLELKINKLTRTILEGPSFNDQEEVLNILRDFRIKLIPNTSGYRAGNLQLNLVQSIPVTPICPAYFKIEVPTVSTYRVIGANIESIRLDRQAMSNVPPKLLEQMGDLSNHTVDLFFTAIDGRPFTIGHGKTIDHAISGPMNLCMHTWCHPHAHPGDDVKVAPELTLFPIMGVERSPDEQGNPRHDKSPRVDPIAFDGLKRFDVHAHPRGNSKRTDDMLYSPDNIHFNLTPESPFALFWSGAKLGNRACLTKMLLILNYEDPICNALLGTIRYSANLHEHLLKFNGVREAIDQIFDPIIDQFEKGNSHAAMQLYHDLAPMYKTRIHGNIWILKNRPMGIHHDFGRVSFEQSGEISADLHSSNQQRAEAIRLFKDSLKQTLVDSQIDLLIEHLSLARSNCSVTLMKCARAFQQSTAKGMQSFGTLSPDLQEAVRFAFWEVSGAPRIPNFGTEHFPAQKNQTNIEALLLAASRQNDRYVPQIEEIVEEAPLTTSSQSDSASELENPGSSALEAAGPSVDPIFFTVSPEEIAFDQLLQMSQSEEFLSKTAEERTACINEVLASLPTKFQDGVYWHYYQQYKQAHPDEQGIGGDNWGGRNIGKDIDVCLEAFMTVHMG